MVNKTSSFQSRKADRVRSELPVVINGVQAIIRNISATGVFLEVKNPVEPNTTIEFFVTLDHPTGQLVFSCQGEVVRTEELEENYGIATKILSMYLMPLLNDKK